MSAHGGIGGDGTPLAANRSVLDKLVAKHALGLHLIISLLPFLRDGAHLACKVCIPFHHVCRLASGRGACECRAVREVGVHAASFLGGGKLESCRHHSLGLGFGSSLAGQLTFLRLLLGFGS
jgi:hypothetical protein